MEQIEKFWRLVGYLIMALLFVGCMQTNNPEVETEGTEQALEVGRKETSAASTAQPGSSATLPPPATHTPSPTAMSEPASEATPTVTTEPQTPTVGDPTASPTPVASPGSTEVSPSGEAIVVDHTSVDDFERIPDEYIQAAADLRMVYIDRSVGKNIDDALDCLSQASNAAAPNHCVRSEHDSPEFSVDPAVVSWSRASGYDRSNWEFRVWEGTGCSEWYGKVSCFFEMIEPVIGQYDVVSYQFSYLAVDDGSTIVDQPGGFFSDNPNRQDVHDLEAFAAQYPDTTFIYWTTSLARTIGTNESQAFNNQMRQYAADNGRVLFDVADILSHDPDGNPCYDNRDGVTYRSESYADDGEDIPAICQHYTTEVNGGHLGSVSAGKIRVAKAFWVLMARIAGWSGD